MPPYPQIQNNSFILFSDSDCLQCAAGIRSVHDTALRKREAPIIPRWCISSPLICFNSQVSSLPYGLACTDLEFMAWCVTLAGARTHNRFCQQSPSLRSWPLTKGTSSSSLFLVLRPYLSLSCQPSSADTRDQQSTVESSLLLFSGSLYC